MASRSLTRPMAAALAILLPVLLWACGGSEEGSGPAVDEIEIPGPRVFPEGIAVDKATGHLFVGSTTDGSIYRARAGGPGPFEPFLPGGERGRTSVTGLKVDSRGRLFAAGRDTGGLFVFDASTGEAIDVLEPPAGGPGIPPGDEGSLLNDLTFTSEAAFVTDSFRPTLYRVALTGEGIGELEPWLDLRGGPIPHGEGFNLNGISASDDGRFLLTVHTGSGELFRIDVRSRAVEKVDLGGETLVSGDGLLLDGRRLLVTLEDPGVVVPVELSPDLLRGSVGAPVGEGELDFPTTIAELDGELFVVNSQLDSDSPELPFSVSRLPTPG